jgi:hypothetical protein
MSISLRAIIVLPCLADVFAKLFPAFPVHLPIPFATRQGRRIGVDAPARQT